MARLKRTTEYTKFLARGEEEVLHRMQQRLESDDAITRVATSVDDRPHPGGIGCLEGPRCGGCGRYAATSE